MFIGNQHLVKDFKALVKAGKLAHGYIFFGEPQVGKLTFACCLANFLESGEFDAPSRIFSDTLVVNRNGNDGGIDLVRELKLFLQQMPSISSKRTIIVDNANELTPQAQNAILKIAEEPPEHSLIILVVNQLESLLPALLSRFQKIYFGRIPEKEIIEFLNERIIDSSIKYQVSSINTKESEEKLKKCELGRNKYPDERKHIKAAAAMCGGRIGLAFDLLTNKDMEEARTMAEKFLKTEARTRSAMIKDIVEIQKEKPDFLDYFIESLIINLRKDPVKNFKIIRSILNRLFLIKSYNTNKRLQMEAFNY